MRFAAIILPLALAGCYRGLHVFPGPATRPPKANNCDLDFFEYAKEDHESGGRFGKGGEYAKLGEIKYIAPLDDDPMKGEARSDIREEACKLGGEAISIIQSYEGFEKNHVTVFFVWAKGSNPPPPKKF